MRSKAHWLCLFVCCCLLIGRPAFAGLRFERLGKSIVADQCRRFDLDGDGTDELLTVSANHVHLYSWQQDHYSILWQLSQDKSWHLSEAGAADILNGPGLETWLSLCRPDSLEILVYAGVRPEAPARLIVTREQTGGRLDARGAGSWDVSAEPLTRVHPASNGQMILVSTLAGFSRQPRGLMGFDGEPPYALRWMTLLGPCPIFPVHVLPRAEAESTRIVIAGAAYHNGATGSGVADSVSALFVMNGLGTILWKRVLGGSQSIPICDVEDLDGDSDSEIVVSLRLQGTGRPEGVPLLLLDVEDGRVLQETIVGSSVTAIEASDLNDDGNIETLLLCESGDLRLYDASLKFIRRTRTEFADSGVLRVLDLGSRTGRKIFTQTEAGTVIQVLDSHFRRVAHMHSEGQPFSSFDVLSAGGEKLVLAQSGQNIEILKPVYGWFSPLLAAVLAIPVFAAGGAVLRRRMIRSESGRSRARLLVGRTRIVRHGPVTGGGVQEPLSGLLRQLRTCDADTVSQEDKESLRFWIRVYEAHVAPELPRILSLAATSHPPAVLFRLARTSIGANARVRAARSALETESAHEIRTACASAEGTIAALESFLKNAERTALRLVPADPFVEAQAAFGDVALQMERAKITFTGIRTEGQIGAKAFIEPAELRRCIYDILVNAIEHCLRAAEPRIGITISYGTRRIVISIEDNGEGVPSERRDAIFHGSSEGKEAGGIGLMHARRVAEDHSGKLLLRESVPWKRTAFEIELCRVPS